MGFPTIGERGFSLVGVMVAAGLIGGLSLALMQIMKNVNDGQTLLQSSADVAALKNEIEMILRDRRHCAASLSEGLSSPGNPLVFDKLNVDEPDKASEGAEVELFYGHYDYEAQPGVRTKKKFSGRDAAFKNYGNVTIDSIKLFMDNDAGNPYPNSETISDRGRIFVIGTKRMGGSRKRQISLDFPVNVLVKTDGSGKGEVVSCASESSVYPEYGYPPSCNISFSHIDTGGTGVWRTVQLEMKDPGFVGLNLQGASVDGNDRVRFRSSCSVTGTQMDSYFRDCSFHFGWRDNTKDADIATNRNPDRYLVQSFTGSIDSFSLGGGVNNDDSFYYKLTCPDGSNPELDAYVKQECFICFGHSNQYRPVPDSYGCQKVQDSYPSEWGRYMPEGVDVDYDDTLFLGFFCGERPYPLVKRVEYTD